MTTSASSQQLRLRSHTGTTVRTGSQSQVDPAMGHVAPGKPSREHACRPTNTSFLRSFERNWPYQLSGNVGQSTITRHLLAPDSGAVSSPREHQCGRGAGTVPRCSSLESCRVPADVEAWWIDIGASNVEELMRLMHRYRDSHEEFDCFIVPTVPPPKQQQDTIATLVDLHAVGVAPGRIQVIFNMVDDRESLERTFHSLLDFLAQQPIASQPNCRVGVQR